MPETIDRDEAIARLEALDLDAVELAGWLYEDDYEDAEVEWYAGDVTVEGGLEVADIAIVVGNLQVKGLLIDSVDVDAGFIGVTGDLMATNFLTFGRAIIQGRLEVAELLYGHSGNDLCLTARHIKANVIAEGGHSIGAETIDATCFRFMNTIVAGNDPGFAAIDVRGGKNLDQVAKTFVPDVLDEEGLDQDALIARLRAGISVLA